MEDNANELCPPLFKGDLPQKMFIFLSYIKQIIPEQLQTEKINI